MAIQVFETEQQAVDHANAPEFALRCLRQWGLSDEEALALLERQLPGTMPEAGDAELMRKLGLARASFVRMSRP